ncbi:capsular biosynthesis protein [Vicingus serpentipes]|uniref:protein-tyrosine-phosphatase n=1 Tax=Vicingus serpentipes TaxID=1926625 RepID=A0A5C6RZP5_9FLAO|nr:CpsB/CapC family capsule biosynthesis tyrosine phosphatase [Vicingus serpentipes]TXB66842.1 capsular biosynthesis protein [Vicingus serpentipes]
MSFFKNIFKKKEVYLPIDFSVFNADMHSHLIPGIDDGSPDMETTISLIKEFKAMGYSKIITTPHIMCDYYKNTPEIILGGLENVREELKKQAIDIELFAAAEYNLDDGLEKLIDTKQILTFGDNYVLFELPFMQEPQNFQEVVFKFQTSGYKPILAHPERYNYWHKNFEKFEEVNAKSVLLQLNLLSLTGHYGPEVKKMGEKLIDANLVDFVGTDCHRIEHLKILKDFSNSKYFNLLTEKGLLNASL